MPLLSAPFGYSRGVEPGALHAEATTITMAPGRLWLPAATTGVFVALAGALHVSHDGLASAYRDGLAQALAFVVVAGAVALTVLSLRQQTHQSRAALETGWLALAVVVALWLSSVEMGAFTLDGGAPGGLSAVGPWVVVICLSMRAPINRTLATSLGAASMWPVAFGVAVARGTVLPAPWAAVLVPAIANYGLALLTCLIRRASSGPASVAPASTSADGDLGSYKLLTQIGAGGMGEVWRATHQMLARQAAIKMVRPRNTHMTPAQREQWVRRFHREANTIAGLQSPNTIYLYDFGVARDGQFYYVMELLDGISLDVLVKQFGPQPAPRVRHILRQVCESLEEAHQRNLVHRDLKPSNIMLCKLALSHDFVKVLDFGLAKCAACEDVAQITLENVAAGTPGYIAPEVALGETAVDGRADLYALGCVAYYLLTGEMVFSEANAMSMVVNHVQTAPARPSSRTELPIPADLEAIVMHCLEKSPAARPQSARQVAAMLEQCTFEPWSDAEAAAWWERHLPESSTLRSGASSSTAVA
jgi:tRNA A-37 threonylcarbamoyl transferase component Bud32